jgi:hypothetical protein
MCFLMPHANVAPDDVPTSLDRDARDDAVRWFLGQGRFRITYVLDLATGTGCGTPGMLGHPQELFEC